MSKVDMNDDRGPSVNRSISAIVILSSIALAGRLTAKRLKKTPLVSSDYTLAVGWLIGLAVAAMSFAAVPFGLGKHLMTVNLDNVETLLKMLYVADNFYTLSLVAIKISILQLYRSIFPGRAFTIATSIVGAGVIAWGVAVILVSLLQCNPVRGAWDITISATCISLPKFYLGNAVPNIAMDVIILALPIPNVWALQMSVRQKLVISGLFLLGGFVCVLSVIRLHFLLALVPADFTYTYRYVAIWSTIEVHTAVMSACLPTLRPLAKEAVRMFSFLRSTINTFGFSDRSAAGPNQMYPLGLRDRNEPQSLSTSKEEHVAVLEPAKAKSTRVTVEQVDLEQGLGETCYTLNDRY